MLKGNSMDFVTEITETIRHDIDLHQRLSEMVAEDNWKVRDDTLDFVDKRHKNRAELEKEIEDTNRSIVNLFLISDIASEDVSSERKKEVVMLMNALRETIKETLEIVNKAVVYLKKDKTETSIQLKKVNMGRKALSSYARYGTI